MASSETYLSPNQTPGPLLLGRRRGDFLGPLFCASDIANRDNWGNLPSWCVCRSLGRGEDPGGLSLWTWSPIGRWDLGGGCVVPRVRTKAFFARPAFCCVWGPWDLGGCCIVSWVRTKAFFAWSAVCWVLGSYDLGGGCIVSWVRTKVFLLDQLSAAFQDLETLVVVV